jgi:hypothetical protein
VGILMIIPSFIQAIYVHNYNKEKYEKKVKENNRRHATVRHTARDQAENKGNKQNK